MWIKTQGGYLLNVDRLDYFIYNDSTDVTYGYAQGVAHAIAKGNIVEDILGNLGKIAMVMEVM